MFFRLPCVVFSVAILLVGLLRPACAAEDYWDFNASNNIPVVGSGTLGTIAIVVGATLFDIEGYGTGTTENRVGSTPAGLALSYLDVGYAFSDHVMEFKGLDFSNIHNVGISYAFRSTEIFSLTDSEYVLFEYSTDGGAHYTDGGSILIAGTDYSGWLTIANSFGSNLDGISNAAIRVSTFASFGVGSSTQYDNIQMVPEPSVTALVGLALILGFFGLQKSRRASLRR